MTEYSGAKVAILHRGQILTVLRDDTPTIPFPNLWDFPGGGREGSESPVECVQRETHEELSVTLRPADLIWRQAYGGVLEGQSRTWFFVATPRGSALSAIRLGEEGQAWRWFAITEFLSLTTAVPHLQARLREFLAADAAPPEGR